MVSKSDEFKEVKWSINSLKSQLPALGFAIRSASIMTEHVSVAL